MAAVRRLKDSRLHFLDRASETLQITSPSISAHLGSVRNGLVDGTDSAATTGTYCVSCGTNMIQGWSCTTEKDRKAKRTRKDRLAEDASRIKVTSIKCSTCSAVTVLELTTRTGTQPPTKTSQAAKVPHTPGRGRIEKPSAPTNSSTNDATQSSKRRTRGKKSSLQALMMNKSPGSSNAVSASGLSLQDFLK